MKGFVMVRLSFVFKMLLAAVVFALSACSANGGGSGSTLAEEDSPSATSMGGTAVNRSGAGPSESCPVTAPPDPAQVPSALRAEDGDPSWRGEGGLWVNPVTDADVAINRVGGAYRMKYGAVTLHEGNPTSRYGPPKVRADRLDGSERVRGSPGGYAYSEIRFWPTIVEFPTPGCWKVTTSWRTASVHFVVQVP